MKIMIIVHSYAPFVGGAQLLCEKVATRLAKEHSVKIITGNGDSPIYTGFGHRSVPAGEFLEEGILVCRLPYVGTVYRVGSLISKIPIVKRFFRNPLLKYLQQRHLDFLRREILSFKPDVVVVMPELLFPTECVLKLHDEMKFPLVMVPQLHEENKPFPVEKVRADLKKLDAVIAVTSHEAKRFQEFYGIPKERVFTAWEGSDLPGFIPKKNKAKTVLYFGRKKLYKGLKVLLEAMPLVWARHPDTELVLAGARTVDANKIINAIEMICKNDKDKVISLDNVSKEKKTELMSSALCLVFPSKLESFGLVVVESWAHKTPAIVFKSPVFESYVEHMKDTYVVAEETPQGLADGILFFLDHPNLAISMGEAGRLKTESQFDWDKTAKEYERVCLYAIANQKKESP